MLEETDIRKSYELARERYSELGVDADQAIKTLAGISISLQCWQGDDVGGFEKEGTGLSGGIMVTGNYPGKARTIKELRTDLTKTYSLLPGSHRLNLHAMYGEFGGRNIDRDKIVTKQFKGWVDWAREHGLKLDFNPTCFSHPKADSGYTISSKNADIRKFWIEHVKRCREIASFIGKELGSYCINNIWIPDGSKDVPADSWSHRELLKESLDEIFEVKHGPKHLKDSVESKLFGIGSESYVVGSHEFYLCYALSRGIMICIDSGHFHPTESISDKISSIMQFSEEMLLHISRGIRWDSDHVVIFNDQIRSITEEVVLSGSLDHIHIALDYFDASINRIGAWAIGARAVLKALLTALLRPQKKLVQYEDEGNNFARLALMDELRTMPAGAIWDYYCMENQIPVGTALIEEVNKYERDVLSKR